MLSFATKMYEEAGESKDNASDTTFLSARRLPDGTRTYRMISHEPELTSFGLELYDEVLKE